jgi:hypothetical protein
VLIVRGRGWRRLDKIGEVGAVSDVWNRRGGLREGRAHRWEALRVEILARMWRIEGVDDGFPCAGVERGKGGKLARASSPTAKRDE